MQLAEVLAGDVFSRADAAGNLITMELVRHRLAELADHLPTCRCGLCDAARVIRPQGVYAVARGWQRDINATTVRARR